MTDTYEDDFDEEYNDIYVFARRNRHEKAVREMRDKRKGAEKRQKDESDY